MNLKYVTFFDIPWEDVIFSNILPRITLLDCCNVRKVSPEFETLIDSYFATMKHLLKRDTRALKASDLQLLASKTKKLERINVQTSELNDETTVAFLRNNTSLTHLNFSYTSLNDSALFGLIQCTDLQQLVLKACTWVTNECLLTLQFHLPKLEYVELTCCPQLDVLALCDKWSTGPSMKHFHISPGDDVRNFGYIWSKGDGGYLYSKKTKPTLLLRPNLNSLPHLDSEGWFLE